MRRISLYLPTTLHQSLQFASKQEKKSLSQLAGKLLDNALVVNEQSNLQEMYKGLKTLGGFGPKGIFDASTTIDQVLYGDNG